MLLASSWAVVVLLAILVPAAARADGDPASDVLATQTAFVPWDAGVSTRQAARLSALLQSAQHDGFPVRVALIASPTDLGSVTALWRHPESYAQFLGEELSLVYHGRVLVAMPDGLAWWQEGQRRAGALPSLTTAGLASNAVTGILRLANDAGHHLQAPAAGSAARTTAGPPPPSRARTPVGALVFLIGLVAIVLAWFGSLRARPPRNRLRWLWSA